MGWQKKDEKRKTQNGLVEPRSDMRGLAVVGMQACRHVSMHLSEFFLFYYFTEGV